MTPDKHASWRPLPVSHPAIPNLLVSAAFSTSPICYSIYITDLANVWLECLDRREILVRSVQEKLGIDPSDDPENFKELLYWIGSAFDAEHPHHADATLALTPGAAASSGGVDDLILNVTCILPAGLPPLKWPVKLKHGGASAVATELVLPLVQAQMARKLEVEALLAVIREKDGVIAKVLDKLDAVGARIDQIFPALAASGKRNITRSFAESRVKGLAPYFKSDFLQQIGTADEQRSSRTSPDGPKQPKDVQDLVKQVFGDGSGLQHHSSLNYCDSPALNYWWMDLGEGSGKAVLVGKESSGAETRKMASLPADYSKHKSKQYRSKDEEEFHENKEDEEGDGKDDDNDDDFEVQATPPHLMSARKGVKDMTKSLQQPYEDGDSTASEAGDEDIDRQIPDSHPPFEISTPRKSKLATRSAPKPTCLGTIGKRIRSQPETDVDLDAATESGSEVGSDNEGYPENIRKDDGAETTALNAKDSFEAGRPSPPKLTLKAKKGVLGRIGGPSKAKIVEDVEMTEPHLLRFSKPAEDEESTESDEASEGPAKINKESHMPVKRLGVIGHIGGGKQASDALLENEAGDSRGRPTSREVNKEQAAREPSEERAKRRREELKQRLAEKPAQGPVRKKRKF